MVKRATVVYRGDVQGVGFRYTACQIARSYAVNGYVRNLPDGTVRLVCEGLDEDVRAFLEDVRRRMDHFIRDVEVHMTEGTGEFTEFDIRF